MSRDAVARAAIVALGFLVYYGVWDNGFYKDDYLWMSAARDEMHGAGVLMHQTVGFFRPLTNVVFYLCERVAGGNGVFYNLGNLVLHLLNGVLVFHLLRLLFDHRFVAAAGATIFVSAHNHSGAVIWVSARTTLVMTAFVLASLLLAAGRSRLHSPCRVVLALAAYAAALATKETAAATMGLTLLLFLRRRDDGSRVLGTSALAGYAALTALYFAVRTAIMGPIDQSNWEIGIHGVSNLFGAVVYSYYPWVVTRLVGAAGMLTGSSSPLWPEAAAVVIVAALVAVAPAGRRRRDMTLAVAWVVVTLLPSVFFTFRFTGEYSHVHNRYYYLAGAGVCASIALLAGWMWDAKHRAAKVAGAVVVAVVVAANAWMVRGVERYWGDSNRRFAEVVDSVLSEVTRHPGKPTVVVTGLEGWQPYFARAMDYRHRERPVVYERGGIDDARDHSPCLLVDLELRPDRNVVFRMYEIE